MIELTVEPRPHAARSPSMLERVMRCTMSDRLSRVGSGGARPVARESAIEGTTAHALLESALLGRTTPDEVGAVWVEGERITVDKRMREAVRVALDWIWRELAGRELLIEPRLSLPYGNIYGYGDVCTAGPPWVICDFKYGFNVVPADTVQIGLYLIGLIGAIEGEGEATAVIIQPRAQAEPVRSHVWTYPALRDLRDQLIEVLDRLRRNDLRYAAGDHCRFCPALASCPHIAAIARDAAAIELAAPDLIREGEFGAQRLDAALSLVPLVDAWARSVSEVGKQYMTDGGKLKNWKLVKKRTGTLTVTGRDDPRPEVNVSETLRAALRSSVARGYLEAANPPSE
jgi:hypothetical protein